MVITAGVDCLLPTSAASWPVCLLPSRDDISTTHMNDDLLHPPHLISSPSGFLI